MAVEFEMFTDEGNEACTKAYFNIHHTIFGDKFVIEGELKQYFLFLYLHNFS